MVEFRLFLPVYFNHFEAIYLRIIKQLSARTGTDRVLA